MALRTASPRRGVLILSRIDFAPLQGDRKLNWQRCRPQTEASPPECSENLSFFKHGFNFANLQLEECAQTLTRQREDSLRRFAGHNPEPAYYFMSHS